MRTFHSYGPVDCEENFCVDRKEMIEKCTSQLIGKKEKGGHYFTIWAPRQTGKTWLIRQCVKNIKKKYKDQYFVGDISMQAIAIEKNDDPTSIFFQRWRSVIMDEFNIDVGQLDTWENWIKFFGKSNGLLKKPLILFIDEFDKLPNQLIDQIVSMFREIYLSRNKYMLHGLALVGVRAVLGVDSRKGSPFNIQKSLNIPNLILEETTDMFDQYQDESGQIIEKQVVKKLYETTNGQPGLISWFGELLTDKWKYNPGYDKTIDMNIWKYVYERACNAENNNTVMNIIAKAKNDYPDHVLKLFSQSDIQFSLDTRWCNYMYMHGIIENKTIKRASGEYKTICCFASSFIQHKIYNAFVSEIQTDYTVPILDFSDDLSDVFLENKIDIPALVIRYTNYLSRLYDKGINPWKNQPRRKSDFHLTEAVGHFHLYHWLQTVLGERCAVIPEFPTGNGKVDIHIKCNDLSGLIEVKSFKTAYDTKEAMKQAAKYSEQTNHKEITVAMFTPFLDKNVLQQISVEKMIDQIKVTVVAIGQG
ncbi:ATPase domain protein, prokaryote domain protein [Candidatus Magnetomorum sp. HK-1]|nr:ATPase domain protein, prokaryote domain protein [Candidatus Magnetomorum sp. HK-1]